MKFKALLIPAVIAVGVTAAVAAERVEHAAAKASFELNAAQLDAVTGGIGLLLPAVQKVRDAAAPAPTFDGAQLLNPGNGAPSWGGSDTVILDLTSGATPPVIFLAPAPER
jgi:hypothetical protein